MNPRQTARVALAVAMTAGFYVLLFGIGIPGLIYGYIWAVHDYGIVYAFIGANLTWMAMGILWSLRYLRRLNLSKCIGLDARRQPELFERISALVRQAGLRMPDEVVLSFDDTPLFIRFGGFAGLGGRDVLIVGLPMMHVLTVSEFDALLVHALGRRHRRIPKLMTVHGSAMLEASETRYLMMPSWLSPNPVFTLHYRALRRLTNAIELAEDRASDRRAAELCGGDALSGALSTVQRLSCPVDEYLDGVAERTERYGFAGSIGEGIVQLASSPDLIEAAESDLNDRLELARPDKKKSRAMRDERERALIFGERIAEIETFPPARTRDERPAAEILRDIPLLEFRLMAAVMRRRTGKALKRVEDSPERAAQQRVKAWGDNIRGYSPRLQDIHVGDIYGHASNYYLCALSLLTDSPRVTPFPVIEPHQARLLVAEVLGCALAYRMCNIGWIPVPAPALRAVQRGEQVFDPFAAIRDIVASRLSKEEWESRIDELGLFRSMTLCLLDDGAAETGR